MFQRFAAKGKWKVQSPGDCLQTTWESFGGNQKAVLNHVLSFSNFLRIGTVAGVRPLDSRFDHSTLMVEVDGRVGEFQTAMYDEEPCHYPRLIVAEWEKMSFVVHDDYAQQRLLETYVLGATVWEILKAKLAIYQKCAEERQALHNACLALNLQTVTLKQLREQGIPIV